MVRNVMALLVCLVLWWGMAHAQQPAASAPSPDEFMTQIKKAADTLDASITDLMKKIEEAKNSKEKGRQVFDEMRGAVKGIHDALADNSRLWAELKSLAGGWEERLNNARNKYKIDPSYKEDVEFWEKIITDVDKLRQNIIDERVTSLSLLQQIDAQKTRLLERYERLTAQQVVDALNKVFADFQPLNTKMKDMVKTSGELTQVAH
jgi:methyl-accepting chemotaxis protein